MMAMLGDLMELVFPQRCAGCGQPVSDAEDPICLDCRLDLPIIVSQPFCNQADLMLRFEGLLPIQHAMAFLQFSKGGITQRLLHGLKYQYRPEIGRVLGQLFAANLKESGFTGYFDYIIPIPLHSKKLKIREYNQSMMIAQGMAEILPSEARDDILIRTRATETQTRKGKLERLLNVGEVFALHPHNQLLLEGKHVLLVDDVITTGSTIESCGKVLLESPVKHISIATIALAGK